MLNQEKLDGMLGNLSERIYEILQSGLNDFDRFVGFILKFLEEGKGC